MGGREKYHGCDECSIPSRHHERLQQQWLRNQYQAVDPPIFVWRLHQRTLCPQGSHRFNTSPIAFGMSARAPLPTQESCPCGTPTRHAPQTLVRSKWCQTSMSRMCVKTASTGHLMRTAATKMPSPQRRLSLTAMAHTSIRAPHSYRECARLVTGTPAATCQPHQRIKLEYRAMPMRVS